MNTKIIVALVIAFAVIGLTGAASAYSTYGNWIDTWIDTNTEITGTHWTSESSTSVSGMPVEYSSESLLVAELVYPIYPEVDMSWSSTQIEGSNYGVSASTRSSPIGSRDEYKISNPSAVEGHTTFFDCAMWGAGNPQGVVYLPEEKPVYVGWYSSHRAGGAYPASLSQSHSIYWP
jgi:hypothetical protein